MKSQTRNRQLLLLRPLGRELPDISSRQKVHHRIIALFHREQLRDLHMSASARSPSHYIPHLFPQCSLLVFPSAAVAEEVFPRLGLGRRLTSAAVPPTFVAISVSEPFQVRAHWRLQSVEPGCQRLHTIHSDRSLAPSFAFQPVAVMFAAFIGLPLHLCRRRRF
jgi:hypothetical protein